MLSIDIPGHGILELEHLVLDLNGTLTLDGSLIPGVPEALASLEESLHVVVITADAHGRASAIAEKLGCDFHVIERGREDEQKLDFVDELGSDSVVAIGNGANDALMLSDSALGIAVVGPEGAAAAAVAGADVIVASIGDALGLLVEPRRLITTLRR
jgi:P-type E1-E2 ATPase